MDGGILIPADTFAPEPRVHDIHHVPVRALQALSPWAKFAFYWSLAEFVVGAGLEIWLALTNVAYVNTLTDTIGSLQIPGQAVQNAYALTVYHGLFVIALFFQFAMTFDAVVHSSLIQIVTTTFFSFCLLGYTVVQFTQASTILSPSEANIMETAFPNVQVHPTFMIEIIIMGVMALFCVVAVMLSFKLYREFGWHIFKSLGADIHVKNQLQLYHVYLLLLKLDVFFFLGFTLQYLVLVLMGHGTTTDIIIHATVGMPSCFILLIIAYFAIRKQSKVLMGCTFLGLLIVSGYLVAKIIDIVQNGNTPKYIGSKNSLTFFEVLTLLFCLGTFVIAILNYLSFGTGVMRQINHAHELQMSPHAPLKATRQEPNRWEIDA